MSKQTREEYVTWCKKRALEYCDIGKPLDAIKSMLSDMNKRDDTRSPAVEQMTMGLLMIGQLRTVAEARKHIEDFR